MLSFLTRRLGVLREEEWRRKMGKWMAEPVGVAGDVASLPSPPPPLHRSGCRRDRDHLRRPGRRRCTAMRSATDSTPVWRGRRGDLGRDGREGVGGGARAVRHVPQWGSGVVSVSVPVPDGNESLREPRSGVNRLRRWVRPSERGRGVLAIERLR